NQSGARLCLHTRQREVVDLLILESLENLVEFLLIFIDGLAYRWNQEKQEHIREPASWKRGGGLSRKRQPLVANHVFVEQSGAPIRQDRCDHVKYRIVLVVLARSLVADTH